MNAIKIILTLLLIFIIVDIVYIAYYLWHNATSKPAASSSSTTTLNASVRQNRTSTVATTASTTIKYANHPNATITLGQVISALGTGWLAASQYTANSSKLALENDTTIMVPAYGIANFSNSGSYLIAEWIEFNSTKQASNYARSAFSTLFPKSISSAEFGVSGNFTYIFYAGPSIDNGQAASIIIANDSQYSIEIFNRGSNANFAQMNALLGDQASALNLT